MIDRKMERKVYHFSGGPSSALAVLLGKPGPNDIVLFCDTGREVPRTYQYIDEFEKNEGIKVHRAIFTHKNAPGLQGYDAYIKAYRKKYLPNVNTRGCIRELKIRTAKRYLKQLGIKKFTQIIGFRHDEQGRITEYESPFKKVKTQFILNEYLVDEPTVDAFWLRKPYRLGLPKILKNCDLCFLKGKDAIIQILQENPEFAEKWIKDEEPKATYINGVQYKDLLKIALYRNSQAKKTNLDNLQPAYSCTCSTF